MLTLPGLGGGSASNIYWRPAGGGGGSSAKTYIDDVFSIYLYKGNQSYKVINNGIKLGNVNAGHSVEFDGSSDGSHLEVPKSTDLDFGTGAFTIEAWVYGKSLATGGGQYDNLDSVFESIDWGAQLGQYSFGISHQNKLYFYTYDNNNTFYYGVSTLSSDQWYHIAVSRDSSGDIRLFLNGTLESTNNNSYSLSNSNQPNPARIGGCKISNNNAGEIEKSFSGLISNLRVVKGQALYTSNFTISTEALTTTSQSATESNVKLLCCNSSIITGSTVTPYPIKTSKTPTASHGPFTASDGVGGLIWTKARESTTYSEHGLIDTERGAGEELQSNSDAGHNFHAARINTFSNSGYAIGSSMRYNAFGIDYTSWTWRKAPGFFDIVKYTGDGTKRDIPHNLNSIPGAVFVKRIDSSHNWGVYHRGLNGGVNPENYRIRLNLTGDEDGDNDNGYSYWANTAPTSTHFTVSDGSGGQGTNTNVSGAEYVAYVFAGGASDAAGSAKSVEFDGTGDYLTVQSNSSEFDPGTGDLTIECWFKMHPSANLNNYHYIFSHGFGQQVAVYNNKLYCWFNDSDGYDGNYEVSFNSSTSIAKGTWYHMAITRSGNTFRLFINGNQEATTTSSVTVSTTSYETCIGSGDFSGSPGYNFYGNISNFRYVKGTAVYTASFNLPTEGLTNITNTKLLCCNKNTITGSTVTPGTITSGGNPQTSNLTPFDDLGGFVFGGNDDQNVIKCGEFTCDSNGNATVNLGWEPQWWLWKKANGTGGWGCYDAMRGVVTGGDDYYLELHNSNAENSTNVLTFTPTGAECVLSAHAGGKFLFIAVRRPDAYVSKPPTLGSDVYAESYGNYASGNNPIPNFTSGFPVDFAWAKNYGGSGDWWTSARLLHEKEIKINDEMAMQSGTNKVFDSNVGWHDNNGYDWYISHMWKRHAGFDVVGYKGNGASEHRIRHNLSKKPEMMWCKSKGSTGKWNVYHKGAGGGTNPATWYILFKTGLANAPGQYGPIWNDTEPTEKDFTVGSYTEVNNSSYEYIMMLFASVTGISDVGYYQGTGVGGNSNSINFGFKPRLLILKNVDSGTPWYLWDTKRGAQSLSLNDNSAQQGNSWVNFTDTGFTLDTTGQDANGNGKNYIYYAHS